MVGKLEKCQLGMENFRIRITFKVVALPLLEGRGKVKEGGNTVKVIVESDGGIRISLDEEDQGWQAFTFSGLASRNVTLHLPKELAEELCVKVLGSLEEGIK